MKDPYRKHYWQCLSSLSRFFFCPCDVQGSSQTKNTLNSKIWFWHYFNPLLIVLLSATSQDIQQYPTVLHIFSSKKPFLSGTGSSTLVTSNSDEIIKLGN